jgi:hypothetical protein
MSRDFGLMARTGPLDAVALRLPLSQPLWPDLGALERRADGRLFAVIGFTIANGRIAEMNILADPERLDRLDLSAIDC